MSILDFLMSGGMNGLPGSNPLPLIQPQIQMPEPPDATPQGNAPQGNGNIANQIQIQLGSKAAPQPNTTSNILSGRFDTPPQDFLSALPQGGTGYGDYAQGIVQSALGKPVTGQQVASSRLTDTLKQLDELSKAQLYMNGGSGGKGGATIMAANQIMADNPGMDFTTAFSIAKSGAGQGRTVDADGNIVTIGGASQAAGQMKYGEQSGKNQSDLDYAAPTKYAEGRGAAAGKTSIENDKSALALNNLDASIAQARSLVPKVALSGPILGRVGAAQNDPDYANLQGSLNSIVLQAKDLYNLGSGQGFSDADRDFLQDVVAGKYSRAETINLALDRLAEVSQKRQQFLTQQNQSFGQEFTGTKPAPTSVPANTSGWSIRRVN